MNQLQGAPSKLPKNAEAQLTEYQQVNNTTNIEEEQHFEKFEEQVQASRKETQNQVRFSQNTSKSIPRNSLKSKQGGQINGGKGPSLLDKETSLFFPCIRVKRSFKLRVVAALLVLALIMERYCFIVSVYKTKYFGYTLILLVFFLNMIFQGVQSFIRRDKHKRRLHEMFNLERTPKIGLCVIGILGLLDMFYAFFLFWPANVIPIWLVATLLQLFIPLNMFFRTCCSSLTFFKIHVSASLIIILGIGVNLVNFKDFTGQQIKYSLLFILCQVFDVISHAIKDSMIRSQPLNQEKFNFKISVSQFIIGIILTPAILAISKQVDYGDPNDNDDPFNKSEEDIVTFIGNYIKLSFQCIFAVNQDDGLARCNFSFLYLIGYVISLFVLQASLTTLMIHKRSKETRIIFSVMVPLTVLAFALGGLTIGTVPFTFTAFDGVGLVLVASGVFLFNIYRRRGF